MQQNMVAVTPISGVGNPGFDETFFRSPQNTDVGRLHLSQDLRRMGGDDELTPRKGFQEPWEEFSLPTGVQVEFNLIDQNNAFATERVIIFWIENRQASSQITRKCEENFFAA